MGIDEKPVTDTFLSVIGVFKVEEEGMEEKPKKKEKKKKQPVAEKNDEVSWQNASYSNEKIRLGLDHRSTRRDQYGTRRVGDALRTILHCTAGE